MPGKVFKLIGKTLHPDGYYTASILSEAAIPKIKLWFRFDKGLIIGPEQREKLIREEQEHAAAAAAAKANEEIPTPGFVLVKESVEAKTTAAAAAKANEEIPTPGFALVKESVEAKTTAAAVISTHSSSTSSSSSSDYYSPTFQSKLGATKRKMHDSYQQRANAKKQRKIQVIDPRDQPQPSLKGKGIAVAARKKKITANRKTRNNNNFFHGGQPKLKKPTSIF